MRLLLRDYLIARQPEGLLTGGHTVIVAGHNVRQVAGSDRVIGIGPGQRQPNRTLPAVVYELRLPPGAPSLLPQLNDPHPRKPAR